ncbi:MAG: ABC transporter permease [Thermomicrobiales bacterium]
MVGAKSIGVRSGRILVKHILPNIVAPLIVLATIGVAGSILTAADSSYLGLGAQPPTAEWGAMLSSARSFLRDAWWMATFPGLAIVLVVLSLNLFGDGLRDILDPLEKLTGSPCAHPALDWAHGNTRRHPAHASRSLRSTRHRTGTRDVRPGGSKRTISSGSGCQRNLISSSRNDLGREWPSGTIGAVHVEGDHIKDALVSTWPDVFSAFPTSTATRRCSFTSTGSILITSKS